MVELSQPDPSTLRDVVSIDGPSGSGKSTVARRLAESLGFDYLDTGAMYRALTWRLLSLDGDPERIETFSGLIENIDLAIGRGGSVCVDGHVVSSELRSEHVERSVSKVSAWPEVRRRMRALQRCIALDGPLVAEGRDIASVVFPAARWKFYLDADLDERARRRMSEFVAQGRNISHEEVAATMSRRDRLDSTRSDGPLRRVEDAIVIDTSFRTVEEVVSELTCVVERAQHGN